ncbi:G/T mismatches repair enzyme [Candidatus Tiddalikarchaeum anstoanum]|nr:G/T mismatches repair enzyme [Candidatus Tiddalikarchaeum anstoanum]
MKKVNISIIIRILSNHVKEFNPPLIESVSENYRNPFFILVSTILSARTKDSLTEKVCNILFKHVKSLNSLEKISLSKLEQLIKPVNFYKTKARHLKELPKLLKDEFNNKIPKDVDSLVKLPGVGRKTANIVSAIAFGLDAIGVDTHVHTIMNRLGYVKTSNPEETEKELRRKVLVKYWKKINYLFVPFGQNICTPVSPHCSACFIRKYCNRVGVKTKR